MIHTLILAVLTICSLGTARPASAQSAVSQYPFCIQSGDYPGWTGCMFNTMQACQASASGVGGECLSNPWYQAGAVPAQPTDGGPIGANDPLPVGPPPN
jgi:hypothetical protein